MLNVAICKDLPVGLHVRGVHDIFPIPRRISPQAALWVRLHSKRQFQQLQRQNDMFTCLSSEHAARGRGQYKSEDAHQRARTTNTVGHTCSVITVSLVTALFQDVVRDAQQNAHIKLFYHFLPVSRVSPRPSPE